MKRISFFYLFVLFIILIYCSSPYINSGDSGEFITTSCVLGIAHSPGYPLYSLLGKVFSIIIPFGNFAYRVNIMNVFLAVLLNLMIILLGVKVFKEQRIKFLILLGTLGTFTFCEPFFRNSVQTEVFILNSVFVVLIIVLSLFCLEKPKIWFLISLICGISLGNHHTIVFLFLGLLFLFFFSKFNFNKVFLFILFFILGFSIYIYLPIRAYKNPYFNWGNPKNLKNLLRVLIRKDYGTFQLTVEKPLERNLDTFSLQIKRFVKRSIKDLKFVLFFVFLSFLILLFKEKKIFLFLFISYLSSGLGFLILANLPFEEIHNGILERFFIMPYTIGIISFILSLKYVNKKIINYPTFCCVCLSMLCNIIETFNICNYRNYFLNYDYGINILRTLKPNSILFMDGGDDTFYTLGYMQAVEKKRQDLSFHDRGGLVFKNIYGEDFRNLTKEEKQERRYFVEKNFLGVKPIYYSTFNKNILKDIKLSYAGVLYYVCLDSCTVDKNLYRNLYSYRSIYTPYYDYRSKALVPIYYFMEAVNEDDFLSKFNLLKYCFFSWPEVDWLKNNILVELHKLGYDILMFSNNYPLAEEVYKFILEINKNDVSALINLGVVYEKLKKFDLSEYYYLKVLEIDEKNFTAFYNLAVLYWNKSDWENVVKYLTKALQIQPNNDNIKIYLQRAILEKNKKL